MSMMKVSQFQVLVSQLFNHVFFKSNQYVCIVCILLLVCISLGCERNIENTNVAKSSQDANEDVPALRLATTPEKLTKQIQY